MSFFKICVVDTWLDYQAQGKMKIKWVKVVIVAAVWISEGKAEIILKCLLITVDITTTWKKKDAPIY